MAHKAQYREAHPLYAVIAHWINLIGFIILILTGFYIHYPAFAGLGGMTVARGLHFFFAFVVTVNGLIRIISSFKMKSAQTEGTREVDTDAKVFLAQKQNKHQMGQMIKYYMFMRKTHPKAGKLNTLQKASYNLIPWFFLVMLYTGFCMLPGWGSIGIFAFGIEHLGGLPGVRLLHYAFMFVFIIFIMIHVYLGVTEGVALLKLMLFWKEHEGVVIDSKTGSVIGYDDFSGKAVTGKSEGELEAVKA